MSTRDDRYYNTHRARTPAADQSGGFFQTGQGGRTLLPPISSGFPISHFPVPPHSSQYSQPRSSPGRYDFNQSYNNQWQQPNNAPMTAPQFYYDDARYSAQPGYATAYNQRPATAAPGHQSGERKLPPLSTTPGPGRDERWASYPTPAFNGAHTSNSHIRSPTASYPASYTTAYPATNAYGYTNDPRSVMALNPHMMVNDPRPVSPYGRNSAHAHVSPPTPPPVSPISSDEPTVKKKRKRADAAQLRVLNETYARTAFPSTEERLALAKALDMSPRSVQIWFQNKRQSMRQTNRQSVSNHQSFSLSPDDNILDEMDYEAPVAGTSRSPPSQMPSSSHRRGRSQEENVIDPRKWPRGY
ncbi:Homeobox domain-containing protein [Mycena sanguinolenta]|uniref:Homeobox domain-containing protein n=1 Tax=Mycena sanguinolenta TaxID=230812 RepID=A0A8H6ZC94_9AGAR|nr:Homeobox domain-containing protein [Mycena sanguinolenta]